MMDKLTSMRVFVKATDLGSFAAAADALQMSPQMVAKHIASLETQLGIVLLNRTTRRQSLTDVGRGYYDRCKIVLAEVEAADSLAFDMHTQPRGTLKVSAPVTFGTFCLPQFVTRFLSAYPDMSIDLSLSDRFIDPLEKGIEVMIRIGELEDSSLIARPLAPYRLIACASPDYLAKRGTPANVQELAKHDCLIYASWTAATQCRWRFTRNGKSEEVIIDGRFRCNDWKALLHAARAGLGITLGPESVLSSEIKAGRLIPVLQEYQGPARPMHVLYPSLRNPTIKLRSFVDELIAEFGIAQ